MNNNSTQVNLSLQLFCVDHSCDEFLHLIATRKATLCDLLFNVILSAGKDKNKIFAH